MQLDNQLKMNRDVTHTINKAIFLESIICLSKGWYFFHGYHDETLTPGEQLRIEEGQQIGELARQLYPSEILIFEHDKEAVKRTSQFVNSLIHHMKVLK